MYMSPNSQRLWAANHHKKNIKNSKTEKDKNGEITNPNGNKLKKEKGVLLTLIKALCGKPELQDPSNY